MLAGCNTTIDPVTSGTLCSPTEADCPSGRELSRSGPGTNILDLVIHNRGPRTDVTFDVRFPGLEGTADGGDATMGDAGTDVGGPSVGSDIFPQTYTLGEGESVTDRFVPAEIFTRSRLFLELSCEAPDCRVEAEYVLLTEQLECQNDGDCSGDQLCSNRLGACVECLRDSDCEDGRDCNLDSGRCLPRPDSGCQTAESAPADPIPGALVLVSVFGLYLLVRRRRRRQYLALLAGLGLSTALLATPDTARAAPPLSTLSIGSGPRFVVGELGSDIQPGVGFEIRETLRSRYIGGSAWIETNYFMSRQAPPPLLRETQIFGFGLGPRVFIPIGDFEIVAGGGYRRVGLAPNPFIDRTGDNSNFHAASGTLAVAYQWDRIRFRVYGSYVPIFDLPASLVSVNVSVGFSSGSTR
jgi:MYXO-CTERM domain-containing protein